MSKASALFIPAVLALTPLAALADRAEPTYAFREYHDLSSVELTGESDLIAPGDAAGGRTTAMRMAYVSPSLSDTPSVWNSRFHFGVAEEVWSAKDKSATPPPGDRPYAGWLYGMIGMGWEDEVSLDLITLRAGVVGPSAQGRSVQNTVNDAFGAGRSKGWGTQLRDEPGVDVEWRRVWRIRVAGAGEGFGADLLPRVGYEIGTVRHYGVGGLQCRFGKNLPRDFGVRSMRDGGVDGVPVKFKSDGFSLAPDAFYGFLDAQLEGRVWDMALDGNMYHGGNGVPTNTFVARAGFGLAAHWSGVKLAAGQYFVTEEYKGQDGLSCFGGITLTTAF